MPPTRASAAASLRRMLCPATRLPAGLRPVLAGAKTESDKKAKEQEVFLGVKVRALPRQGPAAA